MNPPVTIITGGLDYCPTRATGDPPFRQRIEASPWFEAGRRFDGEETRRRLVRSARSSSEHPYCVYVHVPFCSRLCRFCALYTLPLGRRRDELSAEYLRFVRISLVNHPQARRRTPPTTVHFGGGTPLSLGIRAFSQLVAAVRAAFGDSPDCEWAIETTSSSIDGESMDAMIELGLRRVHLGVQTLRDPLRRQIGRRESGDQTLAKVELLKRAGFNTSADLIIGFEGQSQRHLQQDLDRLFEAGIRMFSICELRPRMGRRRVPAAGTGAEERNRDFWDLIWSFMDSRGLAPIHSGQFARSERDNLYYTHPARDEECIAIGPYAHGSAGSLSYANKLLPGYYEELESGRSPIEFGIVYEEPAVRIRKLERQLLAHRPTASSLDSVSEAYPGEFPGILRSWRESNLLVESESADGFVLTRDGSWFVGNMIAQTRDLERRRRARGGGGDHL